MRKSLSIAAIGISLVSSLSFADGGQHQRQQRQDTEPMDCPRVEDPIPVCDTIYHSKRARHAAERVARKAFDISKRGHHHHDAYRRLSAEDYELMRAHAVALEGAATKLATTLHHDVPRSLIVDLMNDVSFHYNAVANLDPDDSNRIKSAFIRLQARIDVLK